MAAKKKSSMGAPLKAELGQVNFYAIKKKAEARKSAGSEGPKNKSAAKRDGSEGPKRSSSGGSKSSTSKSKVSERISSRTSVSSRASVSNRLKKK